MQIKLSPASKVQSFNLAKLTLYVNILSFASSCTAGFHGEKLKPMDQSGEPNTR